MQAGLVLQAVSCARDLFAVLLQAVAGRELVILELLNFSFLSRKRISRLIRFDSKLEGNRNG